MEIHQAYTGGAHQLPRRESTQGTIIHTTGRTIVHRVSSADTPPRDVDKAVLNKIQRRGDHVMGLFYIGQAADVYQIAPDNRVTYHTQGLPKVYLRDTWKEHADPLFGHGRVQHSRAPEIVYDWWLDRWGAKIDSPVELPGGRDVNDNCIGIDLIPQRDGGFTEDQITRAGRLIAYLAASWSFPATLHHNHGHADRDPLRRGTILKAGRTIVGVDWDPGRSFQWDLLRQVLDETRSCAK